MFSLQMATAEISTVSCEGDQEGAASPPSVEDTPSVLNQTSAPLNFSELTPSQFGISVQSFTPAASSNRKGERGRFVIWLQLLLLLNWWRASKGVQSRLYFLYMDLIEC